MDSDDSRPGSSASNSSSNQSDNSRRSSRTPNIQEQKSPQAGSLASPTSSVCVDHHVLRSRQRSSSSQETAPSQRSLTKSDSESSSSSSSSSENEEDDVKSALSNSKTKSKASSGRSSSVGSVDKRLRTNSHNESASPIKSRHSSRNSSASSNDSRNLSRSHSRELNAENGAINMSHEDLSDVSDMESEKRALSLNSKHSMDDEGTNASSTVPPQTDINDMEQKMHNTFDGNTNDSTITDLRQKLDQKKYQLKVTDLVEKPLISDTSGLEGEVLEDLVRTHDEDALDFEAEEGECPEVSKSDELEDPNNTLDKNKKSEKSDGEAEEGEELEEGEVSDEDEKRPEETEPKPVCRFYTRGQCTWGMSCRFLHPGVTDKGNYTMFDMVRAVPVSQGVIGGGRSAANYTAHASEYHDFRTERPPVHHRVPLHHHQAQAAIYPPHSDPRTTLSSSILPEGSVVVESAWERGLRTAKEMMRKANKRKEQDMDFEDKKMNLTLSPDELEKDPYYLKERGSPPDVASFGRHNQYQDPPAGMYSPPDRFIRGPPASIYDEVDPYGRSTRYRELPPHRMPQYEDERRVRPTREVIVQRVEPVGRGDEWNDPWMRSKSPGGRGSPRERSDKRRHDRRSYSSNSSYSSTSSSDTDSSSDSSGSPSPSDHRRRYNITSHKSPLTRRHGRTARSPSAAQKRTRRSLSSRHSPNAKRRVRTSMSPIIEKRSTYSPTHKRKKTSPITKKLANDKSKTKRRKTSSTSASGSSESSASESESESGSSSSQSSSRSRDRAPIKRARPLEKVLIDRKAVKKDPPKKRSPISIEIKKVATVGASALASPTNSVSSEKDNKKTRREELLKQLRAVEDAIAKKRSKLT